MSCITADGPCGASERLRRAEAGYPRPVSANLIEVASSWTALGLFGLLLAVLC